MNHPGKLTVLTLCMGMFLGACGEKHAAQGPSAMKINGQAISVAEVESKAQQYAHLSPTQKQTAMASILKSMADTEILRQAAVQEKLDSDAMVQGRIAESNRLILATAYLEKKMAAVAQPTEAEVKAYYDQNRDRYAERKMFDLQEVNYRAPADAVAEINTKLTPGGKSSDLVALLQKKNAAHNEQQLVVASDKIPDPILQKLRAAHAGDIINLPEKDKTIVLFINSVTPQPLTLAQAAPFISNQLYSTRKSGTMETMLKQLRDKAKIEYVPPYTAMGNTTPGE